MLLRPVLQHGGQRDGRPTCGAQWAYRLSAHQLSHSSSSAPCSAPKLTLPIASACRSIAAPTATACNSPRRPSAHTRSWGGASARSSPPALPRSPTAVATGSCTASTSTAAARASPGWTRPRPQRAIPTGTPGSREPASACAWGATGAWRAAVPTSRAGAGAIALRNANSARMKRFVRRSGRFVELPAGFAPAVGVPLSFGGGEAEVAQADERPP